MAKRKKSAKISKDKCMSMCSKSCSSSGCLYFVGFIGAAVYYISTATGFWGGVVGLLKAIVWPAFLVHGLLKFLGL